jgi:hypothetical protein
LAAAVICILVFLRAVTCDFINWDDTDYLLNNEIFRTFDLNMVFRAFTTIPINYWIPLTWISYAIDYQFWGMNPAGYHLTNVIIHGANTALLVPIADRLLRWRPEFLDGVLADSDVSGHGWRYGLLLLFTALLWGIHPARVESVAWATERKDVLNGLFFLGSLHFYVRYAWLKTRSSGPGIFPSYLLSLGCFSLSLMAKPSGVVLPVMLLLLDWFPTGRLNRRTIGWLILEKLPYLLLAGCVATVTIVIGAGQGSYIPLSEFPVSARLVVIGNALFEYVKLLLHPAGIITYYHLPFTIPSVFIYKALTALAVLSVCLWFCRKRPWFGAALLAFLIPLLPVLQFFPNGLQPALCTRYTYLPTLLPTIVIVAAVAGLLRRWGGTLPGRRLVLAGIATALLVYYGTVTYRLIGDWQDSGTFWTKVIESQPFERAYFYRALFFVDEGDYDAAVRDYTTTLDMLQAIKSPEAFNVYAFRGEALARAGRHEEAIADFTRAIGLFPHQLYYFHRGKSLRHLARLPEAADDEARAGRAGGEMRWFPPGAALQ